MNAFTIYEKHPTADAYRVGGFYSPYALVSTDKRFSDAELAAEFWKMRFDHEYEALMLEEFRSTPYRTKAIRHWCDALSRSRDRMNTLSRFAARPHFDA